MLHHIRIALSTIWKSYLGRALLSGGFAKMAGAINQVIGIYAVTKSLGLSDSAFLYFAIAVISWSNIPSAGLSTSVSVALIRASDSPALLRSTLFADVTIFITLSLCCSAILLFLIVPGLHLTHRSDQYYVLLTGIAMNALYTASLPAEHWLTATRRIALFSSVNAIGSVLSLISYIVFFLLSSNSIAFVFSYYISIVFPYCALYIWLTFSDWKPRTEDFRPQFRLIKELLRDGRATIVFQIANSLKTNAFVTILGYWGRSRELVLVNVIVRLAILGVSGISFVFTPILSASTRADLFANTATIEKWVRHAVSLLTFLGFTCAALAAFCGPQIFDNWVAHAVTFSRMECVAAVALVFSWSLEMILFYVVTSRRNRLSWSIAQCGITALAVTMSSLCWQKLGIVGAVSLLASASIFNTFIMYLEISRRD
jgi:O-antigen/teichoic acid export membrane protein